jgi:hypothetical protein
MTEIINDLIVLGKAVPERRTDGRKTFCLAGYSPSSGFVRVFPCRPDLQVSRWDVICVQVERTPKDTRRESWQPPGEWMEWDTLNKYIRNVGRIEKREARRDLMSSLRSPCVKAIDDREDSLGIVLAGTIHGAYFQNNSQYGREIQLDLIPRSGEWARNRALYPFVPRLKYSCEHCEIHHDQTLIEWGAYEWMHKNPKAIDQYWDNVGLYKNDTDLWLLVGNQRLHRNSFLVIGIIPIKRDTIETARGARYAKQLPLLSL